jgi:hypothetical protein
MRQGKRYVRRDMPQRVGAAVTEPVGIGRAANAD